VERDWEHHDNRMQLVIAEYSTSQLWSRNIPLLAEEGAKRERDSAKP